MKFGKHIRRVRESSYPQWRNSWIDYKMLKRLIKPAVAAIGESPRAPRSATAQELASIPEERAFFSALLQNLAKINAFYKKRVGALRQGLLSLQLDVQNEPIPSMATLAACRNLYTDLLLLENYVVTNYCGFSKILKKHDKNTGWDTREKYMCKMVNPLPFSHYPELRALVEEVECMFQQLVQLRPQADVTRPTLLEADVLALQALQAFRGQTQHIDPASQGAPVNVEEALEVAQRAMQASGQCTPVDGERVGGGGGGDGVGGGGGGFADEAVGDDHDSNSDDDDNNDDARGGSDDLHDQREHIQRVSHDDTAQHIEKRDEMRDVDTATNRLTAAGADRSRTLSSAHAAGHRRETDSNIGAHSPTDAPVFGKHTAGPSSARVRAAAGVHSIPDTHHTHASILRTTGITVHGDGGGTVLPMPPPASHPARTQCAPPLTHTLTSAASASQGRAHLVYTRGGAARSPVDAHSHGARDGGDHSTSPSAWVWPGPPPYTPLALATPSGVLAVAQHTLDSASALTHAGLTRAGRSSTTASAAPPAGATSAAADVRARGGARGGARAGARAGARGGVRGSTRGGVHGDVRGGGCDGAGTPVTPVASVSPPHTQHTSGASPLLAGVAVTEGIVSVAVSGGRRAGGTGAAGAGGAGGAERVGTASGVRARGPGVRVAGTEEDQAAAAAVAFACQGRPEEELVAIAALAGVSRIATGGGGRGVGRSGAAGVGAGATCGTSVVGPSGTRDGGQFVAAPAGGVRSSPAMPPRRISPPSHAFASGSGDLDSHVIGAALAAMQGDGAASANSTHTTAHAEVRAGTGDALLLLATSRKRERGSKGSAGTPPAGHTGAVAGATATAPTVGVLDAYNVSGTPPAAAVSIAATCTSAAPPSTSVAPSCASTSSLSMQLPVARLRVLSSETSSSDDSSDDDARAAHQRGTKDVSGHTTDSSALKLQPTHHPVRTLSEAAGKHPAVGAHSAVAAHASRAASQSPSAGIPTSTRMPLTLLAHAGTHESKAHIAMGNTEPALGAGAPPPATTSAHTTHTSTSSYGRAAVLAQVADSRVRDGSSGGGSGGGGDGSGAAGGATSVVACTLEVKLTDVALPDSKRARTASLLPSGSTTHPHTRTAPTPPAHTPVLDGSDFVSPVMKVSPSRTHVRVVDNALARVSPSHQRPGQQQVTDVACP